MNAMIIDTIITDLIEETNRIENLAKVAVGLTMGNIAEDIDWQFKLSSVLGIVADESERLADSVCIFEDYFSKIKKNSIADSSDVIVHNINTIAASAKKLAGLVYVACDIIRDNTCSSVEWQNGLCTVVEVIAEKVAGIYSNLVSDLTTKEAQDE